MRHTGGTRAISVESFWRFPRLTVPRAGLEPARSDRKPKAGRVVRTPQPSRFRSLNFPSSAGRGSPSTSPVLATFWNRGRSCSRALLLLILCRDAGCSRRVGGGAIPFARIACGRERASPSSSESSEMTGGRPTRPRRDFQVQSARKPCRCQRITVGGRTTWSASRHPAH